MPTDLKGKVAIVTGASSGIGKAIALALAESGAKVALAARRAEKLKALAEQITSFGGEALVVTTDVTDPAQARTMIDHTVDLFGQLDIFVSNAGLVSGPGPFVGSSPSDWKKMFDVNVLGALYGLEPAIAAMKENGSGHLLIVSSGAGRWLYPGAPIYSGTKFALSNIAEMVRRELAAEPIRVTVIEPGIVMTEIFENMGSDAKDAAINASGGEPLEPSDIAEAVLFAATRPARVNINVLTVYPSAQAE